MATSGQPRYAFATLSSGVGTTALSFGGAVRFWEIRLCESRWCGSFRGVRVRLGGAGPPECPRGGPGDGGAGRGSPRPGWPRAWLRLGGRQAPARRLGGAMGADEAEGTAGRNGTEPGVHAAADPAGAGAAAVAVMLTGRAAARRPPGRAEVRGPGPQRRRRGPRTVFFKCKNAISIRRSFGIQERRCPPRECRVVSARVVEDPHPGRLGPAAAGRRGDGEGDQPGQGVRSRSACGSLRHPSAPGSGCRPTRAA